MKSGLPIGAGVLALAALLILPAAGQAQNAGTVTGQVTAADTGQPLAGVQVIVDGTTIGILTDQTGRYRLTSVPVGARRLRAVFIGLGPVTKPVTVVEGETATVDFELSQSAIELDGVVVTATGEQRKREIGNVVSTIPASELVKSETITNMADLLQGRTAGVQVMSSSGTTGMGSRIRIRGSNSISLSNEPLIYLDGIRLESGTSSMSIGSGGQDVSRLNDINPEDIESIEIVKGPSAATLYGTEAANGVIRITTKKGQAGPARWNVYLESGMINDENDYPLNYAGLDANASSRYAEACSLEAVARGLCTQTGLSAYTPLDDPMLSPFGTGGRQQVGVSVSGGTERVNYYVAGEFEGERSPYELSDFYRPLLDSIAVPITDQVEHPNQIRKTTFRANVTAQVPQSANVRLPPRSARSELSYVRSVYNE
jgi:TonB-dependent SusC/RagA subfamily outer membrane receptor